MEIRLRLEGETDAEFRSRVERAARIASVLVRAALDNVCVQAMIANSALQHAEDEMRVNPPLRVEYEQAIAIGDLGSCLSSTRNKHWGDGPFVMPLQRDDPVDSWRVLYIYRETSVYYRRFIQRQRMKRLLSRTHRKLVKAATRATKRQFLDSLTEQQVAIMRRTFGVD